MFVEIVVWPKRRRQAKQRTIAFGFNTDPQSGKLWTLPRLPTVARQLQPTVSPTGLQTTALQVFTRAYFLTSIFLRAINLISGRHLLSALGFKPLLNHGRLVRVNWVTPPDFSSLISGKARFSALNLRPLG